MMKFIFLALFIAPISASSFTLVSEDLTGGWDKKELEFVVNEDSCTALGISAAVLNESIDAALELLNSSPTSALKFKRGGTTTSTSATNPPTIYCTNSMPNPDALAGQGGASVSEGRPVSGYLRLNGDDSRAAYFGNLSTTQKRIVVAHEIGHVLGLGHSEKEYALMYYDLSSKSSLNLSQDDVDGLTWLNPRDELSSGIMGCGTLEDTRSPPPPGFGNSVLLTWLALILIAYLATRPRRIISCGEVR